jgi:hypothetical protein
MSNVKNFGLDGVASSVQLGKGGSKIASEAGKITAKDAGGDLVNIQGADPVEAQDLVTKNFVDGLGGMDFTLGIPSDEVLDGAVVLTSETTVTNAVDALNEILGKLVPTAPANFPNGETLTVTSVGTTPLLASGAVPDNTAGGTLPAVAGASVTRVTAATVATNIIGAGDNVGPGDSGTLQALVNNTVVDTQVLTTGSNNKGSGVLRVSNDQAYPLATPGFWESARAQINGGAATQGWNRFKLNHTAASATNDVYFVRDNVTAAPVVSALSVVEGTQGTLAYSSGVPHYGTGAALNVGFTASNLSGETYKSGTILSVSASNSILSTNNYSAGQAGLPSILARQTSTFTTDTLSVAIDGTNIHNQGVITGSASNPNGTGSTASTTNILVKRGSAGVRVDEMNIPVSVAVNGGPTGNGTRVVMPGVDFPSTDVSALTTGDWSSSTASNSYDAAVVAGVLKHDVINYTTGYLPVGPNRSAFDANQYVTFMFRRTAASKFDISITGSYDQMWIKLPGLSETYTSTQNGWYNMKTLYGGAGIPGNQGGANGSLGCALGAVANGSGSWTATFGTLSSTSSANNIILVRFKLSAGQSISALSFVPATR